MTDHIVFIGQKSLHRGDLLSIAQRLNERAAHDQATPALVFDCETGRQMDINTRGSAEELEARLASTTSKLAV